MVKICIHCSMSSIGIGRGRTHMKHGLAMAAFNRPISRPDLYASLSAFIATKYTCSLYANCVNYDLLNYILPTSTLLKWLCDDGLRSPISCLPYSH